MSPSIIVVTIFSSKILMGALGFSRMDMGPVCLGFSSFWPPKAVADRQTP
jgi:hypothetical protein